MTTEDSPWADPLPDEQHDEDDRYVILMNRLRLIEKAIREPRASDRITISDGIRIGIGMFIALPFMLFLLFVLLSALGLSIGGLLR